MPTVVCVNEARSDSDSFVQFCTFLKEAHPVFMSYTRVLSILDSNYEAPEEMILCFIHLFHSGVCSGNILPVLNCVCLWSCVYCIR